MSDSSLAQVVREKFTGMAWSKMNNSPRRSVSREGKKKSFEWKSEMRLNDFSRQLQDASRGLPLSKRVWWWLYFVAHPSVMSCLISIFPSQQVDISLNFPQKLTRFSSSRSSLPNSPHCTAPLRLCWCVLLFALKGRKKKTRERSEKATKQNVRFSTYATRKTLPKITSLRVYIQSADFIKEKRVWCARRAFNWTVKISEKFLRYLRLLKIAKSISFSHWCLVLVFWREIDIAFGSFRWLKRAEHHSEESRRLQNKNQKLIGREIYDTQITVDKSDSCSHGWAKSSIMSTNTHTRVDPRSAS